MNDTSITFRGYAGTEVRHRQTREANVATVRVASTPRVRKDGEWVDGPTTWYAVTAWRTLADHLRDSVRKGDPLVVHGRLLRTETWAPEGGVPSTTLEVEALVVGHDLNRGISHFIKAKRPEPAPQEAPEEVPGADGEPVPDFSDAVADVSPDVVADGSAGAVPDPDGRATWAA
jgi:single-strand DNA-binding protein